MTRKIRLVHFFYLSFLIACIPVNSVLANQECKDLTHIYAGLDGSVSEEIILELKAPAGYGADSSAQQSLTLPTISWGAQCRAGNDQKCADIIKLLHKWARADALDVDRKTNPNSKFSINTTLIGPIRSYIFAKQAKGKQFAKKITDIEKWLKKVTNTGSYSEYDWWAKKPSHNHLMGSLSVLALMAVIENNPSKLRNYKKKLGDALSNIRSDGSFVDESRRGTLALFYSAKNLSFIFGTIITMEEYYEEIVGEPFLLSDNANQNFHKAMNYLVNNIVGERSIIKYARENHFVPGFGDWKKQDVLFINKELSWLIDYIQKYQEYDVKDKVMNGIVPEFSKTLFNSIRYKQFPNRNTGFQTGCGLFRNAVTIPK